MSQRKNKLPKNSSFSDISEDERESKIEKVAEKPKEPESKLQKVFVRTIMASAMSLFFLLVLQAGHFYCILLGFVTQIEIYRELVNVRYVEAKEKKMPYFRSLQWAWFYGAMFFVYGETLHNFCIEHHQLKHIAAITVHWTKITFALYCLLFVASVLTFDIKNLRFQLSQIMWSIVIVCIVVFQCKFFATNTLKGLFWFFFPFATVVMNDVSAYFCGITMGKRFIKAPFLTLSPNKTWEGFIGAGVLTIIFSFFFPLLLAQWTWFTCPAEELNVWPIHSAPLTCIPHPVFTETFTQSIPFIGDVTLLPIQVHGLSYGLFAALVSPFGGFFASAIKRAYDKKDFESFLPGHGGLMDRMDCQLVMMAFTTFHLQAYIFAAPSVKKMETLAALMTPANQALLLEKLQAMVAAGAH